MFEKEIVAFPIGIVSNKIRLFSFLTFPEEGQCSTWLPDTMYGVPPKGVSGTIYVTPHKRGSWF